MTMNLEHNPTVEQLRDLLRKCDDQAAHHVLWVAKNGDVHMSQVPKDKSPVGFEMSQPTMQLRWPTFQAGNEYVGPDAAEDANWVNELFETLVAKWPKVKRNPAVECLDEF